MTLFVSSALLSQTTNIALGKKARQSSDKYNQGAAANAVDGNKTGKWTFDSSNTITHTNDQKDPWWEVDLGATYDISKIEIWNRTDECCWNRLQNFYIMVSENPIAANSTTENQFIGGAHQFTTVKHPSMILDGKKRGRYVRIFIPGENKVLSLTEVEVFGTPVLEMNCAGSRTGAKVKFLSKQGQTIKLQVDWNEGATFVGKTNLAIDNGVCETCPTLGGIGTSNPRTATYVIKQTDATKPVTVKWGGNAGNIKYCGADRSIVIPK